MSDSVKKETSVAVTPRLVFDNELTDDDVPHFLRKDHPQTKVTDVRDAELKNAALDVDGNDTNFEETPGSTDGTNTEESPAPRAAFVPEAVTDNPVDSGEEFMPVTELDELSVEELERHQEEVDAKIREKKEAEKKAVIDQIINVVKTYDIGIEELVEALGGMKFKRKGVKAVQKYQDPVSGATWSGRGKEPAWIKDQDRTKFLIKN